MLELEFLRFLDILLKLLNGLTLRASGTWDYFAVVQFAVWLFEMDNSKNRLNDHLGVNKIGKNIKKSPLHQPNFANNAVRPQPQPQVYNISKNDFRNVVQQLTGSPSHNDPLPRPPHNPPKPQSMRLQRIRPPPLTPINRPRIPHPVPALSLIHI